MQLCSHRYLRITGLLSTPLVNVRIGDWLCILPAITLVVYKSKKVNNAASSDWWTAKPPRWKAHTIAFPPGRGERPLCTEFFTPHSTLYKVLCNSHKHHCMYRQSWQTWHSMHCMLRSSYRQCRQTRYPTQYTIALLWSFVSTVLTCPLMYTQQIRWQWVASSLSNSK